MGDQPLVRLALHPPLEGRLQLGATIAGTLDFRFSQEAAQQSSAAPRPTVFRWWSCWKQRRWYKTGGRPLANARQVLCARWALMSIHGCAAVACLFQRLIWSLMVYVTGAASGQSILLRTDAISVHVYKRQLCMFVSMCICECVHAHVCVHARVCLCVSWLSLCTGV